MSESRLKPVARRCHSAFIIFPSYSPEHVFSPVDAVCDRFKHFRPFLANGWSCLCTNCLAQKVGAINAARASCRPRATQQWIARLTVIGKLRARHADQVLRLNLGHSNTNVGPALRPCIVAEILQRRIAWPGSHWLSERSIFWDERNCTSSGQQR